MPAKRRTIGREPTEAEIQAAVCDWMSAERIAWFRLNSGVARPQRANGKQGWVRYGTPGMADLLVFLGPFPVWLECKTRTGTQSGDQIAFARKVEALGHQYWVVRSVEDASAAIVTARELNYA
jgi:hypothetical protein